MNLYFRHRLNLCVIKKLYCKPYCLNKFFLVSARGYWSFEIAHNSKVKRNAGNNKKTPSVQKKSNSVKSIQVDNNYWNSWKMHFSSKPIEFWNSFMNMILKGQMCLYSGWKDKVTAQSRPTTVLITMLVYRQVWKIMLWLFFTYILYSSLHY